MVPLLIFLLLFELFLQWQMFCLFLEYFDIEIGLLLSWVKGKSSRLEKQATEESWISPLAFYSVKEHEIPSS